MHWLPADCDRHRWQCQPISCIRSAACVLLAWLVNGVIAIHALQLCNYQLCVVGCCRYPFLVQVQGANGEFCSGALINPLTVLTAGHCVPSARTKGEWEKGSFLITARAGTEQAADYSASWFVRHPGFDPAPDDSGYGYVNNDVALIRLDDCALSPEYAT